MDRGIHTVEERGRVQDARDGSRPGWGPRIEVPNDGNHADGSRTQLGDEMLAQKASRARHR